MMDSNRIDLTLKLKAARGEAYVKVLAEYERLYLPEIVDVAQTIRNVQNGEFTVTDIGCLCIRYDLPFKTLCEMLEGLFIPTGVYDRVESARLKVSDILDAAQKKMRRNRNLLAAIDAAIRAQFPPGQATCERQYHLM